MDDLETKHRRARLRELIDVRFDKKLAHLIAHIQLRTRKAPNQGELSALRKDDGPRSFGDKKARALTQQIGLPRRWFDLPLGACLFEPWLPPEEDARSDESALYFIGDVTEPTVASVSEPRPAIAEDSDPQIARRALTVLESILGRLDANLVEAGRATLSRWARGDSSGDEAASTLTALLIASRQIEKLLPEVQIAASESTSPARTTTLTNADIVVRAKQG